MPLASDYLKFKHLPDLNQPHSQIALAMAPKKSDARPSRRSGRSRTTKATNSTTPTPHPAPQDAPAVEKVPRPAVWEPVDLRNETEWAVDNPEYFDEIHEGLASLFDRKPKGWKTKKTAEELNQSEAVVGRPTLEDVARTHAYHSRLKVHNRRLDGSGRLDESGFDDTWHAQRLLGAGTFGRVGLWVRRDENDQIIDEMAIKEEDYLQDSIWAGGIPEEAMTNEFMNRGDIENIQRLRGFKSFKTPSDNPVLRYKGQEGDRRWRYYFEYAPHGSLERLIARYRAWNQYLPESFLWHVFDGLAQILVTFDETKPVTSEYKKGMLRAADRLVHFDIKPDNIFLGYEQPFNGKEIKYGGHQSNVYPMIKIGDFGIAAMTSEKDTQNPGGRFWNRGTPYYLPPEQTHYGLGFPVPPNGKFVPLQDEQGHFIAIETRQSPENPANIFFTQPMNVWGVGKVMYDLATLSHRYDYAGLSTQDYKEYEEWNKNAIQDFQKDPFTASNPAKSQDDLSPSPYTRDLMNLIEQCMKPAAKDRIKAQEAKAITEKMLARYGGDDGLEMNQKVYFRGNEINDMEVGSEDFPFYDGPNEENPLRRKSWTDIDQLMDYSVDPDEPELQPPRWPERLDAYKEDQKKERSQAYNKYWQDNCRIENDKVIFHKLASPGAAQTDLDSNEQMTTNDLEPPEDQDNGQFQSDNVVLDADDESSEQEPTKASRVKSPSREAASKKPATAKSEGDQNGDKKGAKNKVEPTKATKGAGVRKNTTEKAAPVKHAAKKSATKKPAAQASSTTTDNTPQVRARAPGRERLARTATKEVKAGQYKV